MQSPSGPSREASEILNRVVISKPEVDIDRERERMAEAVPSSPPSQATPRASEAVNNEGGEDSGRPGNRSRHDHTASSGRKEKNSKFGDYFLGNTLGEGEFGKVKMGWKQEGGVQVAIKLIRRDSVGTSPTRLAKIYREITILRDISHPNIVRLHEMVETEKQIGIILEYASGGELFDYILNHRYLKDNAARRLFAQLVSGVGPDDELGDEIEYNLSSREYVKRMELDKILPNGTRRGDLMQTSCGSPCYAAPELVVSDSLYTGRKVDVWSCGVILYAMLAGYLPFDDDPANPEGDNINLLYKYIVSTPLTFPEYVTPHARDLLRRILVPDPRKRADLFEVARHSWLSEYSHVVGFITSSTSTTADIATTTIGSIEQEAPPLARSSSVREPSKPSKPATPAVGELGRKHGGVDPETVDSHQKSNKDNKRRTVQVEYVAPRSQTQRGEPAAAAGASSGSSRSRARAGSTGPVEVPASKPPQTRRQVSTEKPLPRDPPVSSDPQYANQSQGRRPSSSTRQQGMLPPPRQGRDSSRAASDTHAAGAGPPVSIARPNTGGSMTSTASRQGMPLTNRGSYSQPAAPTVAGTNAHGRMTQPKGAKQYNISKPMLQDDGEYDRPASQQIPARFAQVAGFDDEQQQQTTAPLEKGHKRSNTIGGFFSRSNSVFGGKSGKKEPQADRQAAPEKQKKYPPVSMSGANMPGQHDWISEHSSGKAQEVFSPPGFVFA
ncbi:putative Serine/threonine-protein kinase KIN4 [Glarea lozoyensis 74030]|uniref:Serine/threonine-protein kinase ATG1 n=1 Tax=Glarea lozoyensis (strain ATCC 74030 / MF5533) TaxID=1104152 RepID=H0EJT9_GLAL7|nr:putative Serine/threonine-protein kinase KIN4 [Glarea lozoyensis 74030]